MVAPSISRTDIKRCCEVEQGERGAEEGAGKHRPLLHVDVWRSDSQSWPAPIINHDTWMLDRTTDGIRRVEASTLLHPQKGIVFTVISHNYSSVTSNISHISTLSSMTSHQAV